MVAQSVLCIPRALPKSSEKGSFSVTTVTPCLIVYIVYYCLSFTVCHTSAPKPRSTSTTLVHYNLLAVCFVIMLPAATYLPFVMRSNDSNIEEKMAVK